MVKLSKIFNTYDEILEELISMGYEDDVVGFRDIDVSDAKDLYDYSGMLRSLNDYVNSHLPGYMNPSYPNCISCSVGPFGFSYMKDGMGFGISTKVNRKTGDVSFMLTFSFAKEKNFLKHNSVFNYAMDAGYDLKEFENKTKKVKQD